MRLWLTRKLKPLAIISVVLPLAVTSVAAVAVPFAEFTSRVAFEAAITHSDLWTFEEFAPATQPTNALSPDGQVVLTLANANPIAPSFFPPVTTLSGMGIYFNPQLDRAFLFPDGMRAFGISIAWGDIYDPDGVDLEAYDKHGSLVGTVTITKSEALSGPFVTSGGDTYEGFLGFITPAKVESVRFSQVDGSVWYDNAIWTTRIPEPATLSLLCLAAAGLIGSRRKYEPET